MHEYCQHDVDKGCGRCGIPPARPIAGDMVSVGSQIRHDTHDLTIETARSLAHPSVPVDIGERIVRKSPHVTLIKRLVRSGDEVVITTYYLELTEDQYKELGGK